MIAGRMVKHGGQLLLGGLPEKMAHLHRSGERIVGDFGVLQRRAG
jgi:hypothetical protein